MNNEIWKMYPEFNFIQVSTIGRVRTLDRVVSNRRGTYVKKGRILKQSDTGHGYLQVGVYENGKKFVRSVHRLVAQTFLPNPDNLPEVNHKDCDRTNNCVDNLEWCDNSYNMQYREKYGVSQTEAAGHPLIAVNLTTLEVSRFRAQNEASRVLGVSIGNLNEVIKGKRKTAGGYWFTNADSNAVAAAKQKFGSEVADKVEDLMNELQPA